MRGGLVAQFPEHDAPPRCGLVAEYDSHKNVLALYVPGPAIDEPVTMSIPHDYKQGGYTYTPAMAAGVTPKLWEMSVMVKVL
jgi:hypothetical protein